MKPKHDIITYQFAAFFLILALVLAGCQKPAQTPKESPQPTPQVQPTPTLDTDADRVRRNEMLNVSFTYDIFVNGERLKQNKYEVDGLELPNAKGEYRVLVPLRATGETLGYRVNWQPRKRRVSWNNADVPAPITLVGGWSYLPANRFEKWLQRFDNLATVKPARFDDVTGYIHIETHAIKGSVR